MREPLVMRDPMFYPGVCVSCGVQSNRRWYVELGIDLDMHFNPMYEGNIIFCNECWNALVKSVNKMVKAFVLANRGTLDPQHRMNGLSDGTGPSDSVVIGTEQTADGSDPELDSDDSEIELPANVLSFNTFFSGTGRK